MQKKNILKNLNEYLGKNKTVIKDKVLKNKSKILFVAFLIFYIVIGVQITYNMDFTDELGLLFNTDTSRIIDDMSNIFINHYRLTVHPLFVILAQPIYFILSGITQNKMLAIIIMSSLASSISVVALYKTFQLFSKNEKANILLSICYGISFSCIIFTANVETYNYATMFLILLWYFVIKKIKQGWKKQDFITLIALGIASFAITVTNFVIFLIACLVLALSKTIKLKKLILIDIITVLVCVLISALQHFIWQNTPIITAFGNTVTKEQEFTDYDINLNNVKVVIRDDLYNSIAASNIYLKRSESNGSKWLNFTGLNTENAIVISLFFLTTFVFAIKNFKNNWKINIGLILSIVFNVLLHILYGNTTAFLYSMHFVYLLFLMFGYNCLSEDNKKIKKSILVIIVILITLEIIKNSTIFLQVLQVLRNRLPTNFYLSNFGIVKTVIVTAIITAILFAMFIMLLHFIKKISKTNNSSERNKYLIFIIEIVILFESTFVLLQTVSEYRRLPGINLESKSNVNIQTSKNYKMFKEAGYKEEVEAYLQYVEDYETFIEKYNCEITSEIPNISFYLFGMGNRKKILYKDGNLIDIETNKTIGTFNVQDYLIIPNEYTVLIRQKNGKYTKIYENEDGVFIDSKVERKLISGTNVYIKLYPFKERALKSIRKVLYSEILFNIKNSKPYSNILVYDKPCDEETAKTCLEVLRQTDNVNLIKGYKAEKQKSSCEQLIVNNKLYPLTWEKEEQVDYSKLNILGKEFTEAKISPTNLLKASEMLLFLLDETEDLKP